MRRGVIIAMTTSIQPSTLPPATGVATAAEKERAAARVSWRWVWIPLVVVLIFGATYALSWYNAYQLTDRFVRDADATFAAGAYLDALVGYQTFDPEANEYV